MDIKYNIINPHVANLLKPSGFKPLKKNGKIPRRVSWKGGVMTSGKKSGAGKNSYVTLDFGKSFKYPPRLFEPIVQTRYKKSGRITLEIFFFIRVPLKRAKSINGEGNCREPYVDIKFHPYYKDSWQGTAYTPEFLIQYQLKSGKGQKLSQKFYGFHYTLVMDCKAKDFEPKYITTYLWNSDPEGSRGTVSDPQSGG